MYNINDKIKKPRWRWMGHVVWMNTSRHPCTALKWIPSGKRRQTIKHMEKDDGDRNQGVHRKDLVQDQLACPRPGTVTGDISLMPYAPVVV